MGGMWAEGETGWGKTPVFPFGGSVGLQPHESGQSIQRALAPGLLREGGTSLGGMRYVRTECLCLCAFV